MSEFDSLRQTNNGIFRDVFWAHLVHDASAAGLERLESLLAGHPGSARLQAPFQLLERGRLALMAGDERAGEMIWESNRLLLRHEQEAVVQPNFDRFSRASAATNHPVERSQSPFRRSCAMPA